MRLTQHSGRQGSPKHNDRTFDLSKADNINASEEYKNFYNDANNGKDFKEGELDFYKKNYSDALKLSNEKKIKQRHPEKVRSIEDIYNSSRTRPEELILQIGSVDDKISLDTFEECAIDYIKELIDWNKKNGNHMKIMNYAMHYDESSPHLHLRRVWDYRDENGNLQINQNKALELAGVELPNPDAKISRYNNRKITFDKMMREKWFDICEKHGLKVEREPLKEKKRHLSVKDYKNEKAKVFATEFKKDTVKFLKNTINDVRIMAGQDEKHRSKTEVLNASKRFIENSQSFFNLLEDKYKMPVHTIPEDDSFFKFLDWNNLSQSQIEELQHRELMKLI